MSRKNRHDSINRSNKTFINQTSKSSRTTILAKIMLVTNINHVKFDIHTLDNMEVTRTFTLNLHIQTILAKIMWHKLEECTASTIDQFFTWKQTFFGPNPTFLPLPPCNVFRKERLAGESSNIASGGKGERANIAAIREKGTLSHTF